MALKVVEKQSVGDVVFDQMMHALSTKEWSPGMKIPGENELAKSMGVSRVTVRGALQKLAALGLVESRQGEGTFVSEPSGAQGMNAVFPTMILGQAGTMDMLEFREAFECGSAALAARHADEGDIARLQDTINGMQREELTIEQRRRCDADFHVRLGEATKNPMILKVYDILKYVFYATIEEVTKTMGLDKGIYYHSRILDAIKARDEKAAYQAMHEHIQDNVEFMKSSETSEENH